jgi:hypothetical protein
MRDRGEARLRALLPLAGLVGLLGLVGCDDGLTPRARAAVEHPLDRAAREGDSTCHCAAGHDTGVGTQLLTCECGVHPNALVCVSVVGTGAPAISCHPAQSR